MKEVANILAVKPGTVAFHKYRMMEMLNIKTNAELLQYAINWYASRSTPPASEAAGEPDPIG